MFNTQPRVQAPSVPPLPAAPPVRFTQQMVPPGVEIGDVAKIVAKSTLAELGLPPTPTKARAPRSRARGRGGQARSPAGRSPSASNSKSPSRSTRSQSGGSPSPKGKSETKSILKSPTKSAVEEKKEQTLPESVPESQSVSGVAASPSDTIVLSDSPTPEVNVTEAERAARRNTKDSTSRNPEKGQNDEDMDQS